MRVTKCRLLDTMFGTGEIFISGAAYLCGVVQNLLLVTRNMKNSLTRWHLQDTANFPLIPLSTSMIQELYMCFFTLTVLWHIFELVLISIGF